MVVCIKQEMRSRIIANAKFKYNEKISCCVLDGKLLIEF
jgi:hypothetical protein